MTLWWAPVIGIAIGILVLGTFVTQRKRTSNDDHDDTAQTSGSSDDDLDEYEARVLQELDSEYDPNDRRR